LVASGGGDVTSRRALLVVGAGPTGLTLALQARAHGMCVRVVDRRNDEFRPSRALLLHARTLEVLRPLGVVDAILAKADTAPRMLLHGGSRALPVSLGDFALADTPFPHLTVVRQADIEHVLADALAERGVPVERGTELIALDMTSTHPRATLRSRDCVRQEECGWVAGCDGATSTVRTLAGIGWSGRGYRHEVLLADVELAGPVQPDRVHAGLGRGGLCLLFPCGERASWRLLGTRRANGPATAPGQFGPPLSLAELAWVLAEARIPARISDLAWSSRIRLQHRLATSYRRGAVFIAGDAAHVHSPAGGQGMNTGIQDAVNLGWKLALAPSSTRPRELLDSYEQERRPVARAVRRLTDVAFQAEAGTDPLTAWVRGSVAPHLARLLPMILGRRGLVGQGFRMVAQLDVGYRHSVLSVPSAPWWSRGLQPGDRFPDSVVTVDGRAARAHDLVASPGVHVLIGCDVTAPATGSGMVSVHRLDDVHRPGIVAVRPDGYVGLVGDSVDEVALGDWLAVVGAAAGRMPVRSPGV
jgi:2-polyprenyl-6-methoxyphenol hydroxylase-like FAD-dependent oxidoreductase